MTSDAAQRAAETIVMIARLYVILGALFAAWFALAGAARLNPQARAGTLGFRLLILPAAVALWPFLLAMILAHRAPSARADGERA